MMRVRALVYISCCFLLTELAGAQAPQKTPAAVASKAQDTLTASDIAKKAFGGNAAVGFQQGTADLKLVVTSAQGDRKERSLSFKARRDTDNLIQYLIKFEKPADVRGTAFLVRERKNQLPDQYVYIPALKVVQRVAAGNASSSFFGSDFSYADLLPYPADKQKDIELNRLADQTISGQDMYVLEILPKVEGSPYGRIVTSISKKDLIPLQVEFFDPSKKPLKSLSVLKLQRVDNKLVPVQMAMKNLQTKSQTDLFINNIDTKARLSANDFTEAAMQR